MAENSPLSSLQKPVNLYQPLLGLSSNKYFTKDITFGQFMVKINLAIEFSQSFPRASKRQDPGI